MDMETLSRHLMTLLTHVNKNIKCAPVVAVGYRNHISTSHFTDLCATSCTVLYVRTT